MISIRLPFHIKNSVLALGANSKNTVCFVKGRNAEISPLHADLDTPNDLRDFEKDARFFSRHKPQVIALDLHPGYQSTKFAQEWPEDKRVSVQHHHAHIASCMVQNGLRNQKVIGVAFDGTGLGDDATLWGAEFLVCDYKNYRRSAHLQEIRLIGAEKAIQEPWRVAAAWLYRIYKERFLSLGIDFTEGIDKKKWPVLKSMYLSGFNSPLASSMGRLFDAVASLVLVRFSARFEAELAIALEKLAKLPRRGSATAYEFAVNKRQGVFIIDPEPMFRSIIHDLKVKKAKEEIAFSFHLTVAQMIRSVCARLRKDGAPNKVVLSGGVFQNKVLLKESLDLLYKERFQVFTHRVIPCNDACISLGQAVIAGGK